MFLHTQGTLEVLAQLAEIIMLNITILSIIIHIYIWLKSKKKVELKKMKTENSMELISFRDLVEHIENSLTKNHQDLDINECGKWLKDKITDKLPLIVREEVNCPHIKKYLENNEYKQVVAQVRFSTITNKPRWGTLRVELYNSVRCRKNFEVLDELNQYIREPKTNYEKKLAKTKEWCVCQYCYNIWAFEMLHWEEQYKYKFQEDFNKIIKHIKGKLKGFVSCIHCYYDDEDFKGPFTEYCKLINNFLLKYHTDLEILPYEEDKDGDMSYWIDADSCLQNTDHTHMLMSRKTCDSADKEDYSEYDDSDSDECLECYFCERECEYWN